MVRYLFTADLVLNPDGTLAQNVPFTCWDSSASGTQYTDIVAPDGVTPLTTVTTPAGQRPDLRGPDGVKGFWQDTGADYRQYVASAEALDAKLAEAPGGGSVTDTAVATYVTPGTATGNAVAALPVVANKVDKGVLLAIDTDYASLAAALAATVVGGTLEIRGTYTLTSPFAINKACTVRFARGASITATSGHAIDVTASGVTLEQPKLIGSGSSVAGTSCGIRAIGVVTAQITDLHIKLPNVSQFDKYGIYLEHVVGFSIDTPAISNIAYGGIMTLSCMDGTITRGAVRTLTQPSGFTNSYGIALSRNSAQSITDAPRSARIRVDGVLVSGVPGWEGIDTHAGTDLTITNNIIYNTNVGIALVGSTDTSGATTYAPQRVVCTGNTVDAQVSDGSRSNGIQLVGAGVTVGSPVEAAQGCVIAYNKITDHGSESSASTSSGGIVAYFTKGAIIGWNTIIRPGFCGVQLYHSNDSLMLTGNVVEDAWSTAQAYACVVWVRSTYNTFTVGGTQVARGSKSATQVNSRGLQVSTSTSNAMTDIGGNQWASATLPTSGANTVMKTGFYGATPVAKPASPGTATGTDAAVINALTTALRNLGLVT